MLQAVTFGMPFTIAVGLLIGLVVSPVTTLLSDALFNAYDRAFPVVSAQASLISSNHDEVVISLRGVKLRDCSYLRLQAYSTNAHGETTDAFIGRMDGPTNGETRPKGAFMAGEWKVWPVEGAVSVVVYVNHLCGHRVVLTKLADIPLSPR
jgi:hypothetical protein